MKGFDFSPIDNLLIQAKLLNEVNAWFYAIDKEVQDEIIRLNTEDQLYSDGIDSLGRELGQYSPLTVILKRAKGQRFDHITLNDEGDFYESFKVTVQRDGFTIDANDSGKYDEPLFKVWGVDVAGLTDENIGFLSEIIKEKYIEYVKKQLQIP